MRNQTRRTFADEGARRRTAGQSLVVAVIVLFLLMFLGAIFAALIVRNLRAVRRATNVSSSQFYAEAGLRYLDQQLMVSSEGADWRPIPDSLPVGYTPLPTGYAPPDETDPDYSWLKPYDPATGEGGFTRVPFGGPTPTRGNLGGRALVRITYQPVPPDAANVARNDPLSKYLKLESVGRVGFVDKDDPTTFGNSESQGLRRELLAYKSIGITDYVRSIWNKDNKPVVAELGMPFPVYDRPNGGAANTPDTRDVVSEYHGPIFANADLTFYGVHHFFLDPARNDVVTVAGKILLDKINPGVTNPSDLDPAPAINPNPGRVTIAAPSVNLNPTAPNVFPSDSPAFDTLNGLVRDAMPSLDSQGNVRSVARQAPPVIDTPVGPNGVTRYVALTRESPPLPPEFTTNNPVQVGSGLAGNIGWGRGMYLPNRLDTQAESASLFGAYSLRGDWLSPSASAGRNSYWRGDFLYVPPAMTLELTPRYIKLTQSPYTVQSRGGGIFRNPENGQRIASASIIRYSDGTTAPTDGIAANVPDFAKFQGYPFQQPGDRSGKGDFVIYADGNIRIRGTLGGKDAVTGNSYVRHLTVVSNGTIYVDGNVLRDNLVTGDAGRGESSIALLARDYIAVNTTQFLAPADVLWQSEGGTGQGPFFLSLDSSRPQFPFSLSLGPSDVLNTPPAFSNTDPLLLFVRHASDFSNSAPGGDGAAINLFVNGFANPFDFGGIGPVYPVPSQTYVNDVFSLVPGSAQPLTDIGANNTLLINYDVGGLSRSAYKLTRVGIAPLDIRIEAFLYAQENSFFVIPGPWFNPNPNDTYANFLTNGRRDDENLATPSIQEVNPTYPFYREPMDVRITVFGAVAENLPAQVGDQGAWLEKWGWVPRYYGSSGLPAGNPQVTRHGPLATNPDAVSSHVPGTGLTYAYNDMGILPYLRETNNPLAVQRDAGGLPIALRTDAYGRTLPVVPRLPVAQGLLYEGENPIR